MGRPPLMACEGWNEVSSESVRLVLRQVDKDEEEEFEPQWCSIRWKNLPFVHLWALCVGHSDCVYEFEIGRMKLTRGHTARALVEGKLFY